MVEFPLASDQTPGNHWYHRGLFYVSRFVHSLTRNQYTLGGAYFSSPLLAPEAGHGPSPQLLHPFKHPSSCPLARYLSSPQSCQRDRLKAFLSDFPLLLKSLQWSKDKIDLKFRAGPWPPFQTHRPPATLASLFSPNTLPLWASALWSFPWNTLPPDTRSPHACSLISLRALLKCRISPLQRSLP